MKNIYLTLLGAFFTMLPCKSQTLSDGKVWNFVQRMYEHEDIERAYTVTVLTTLPAVSTLPGIRRTPFFTALLKMTSAHMPSTDTLSFSSREFLQKVSVSSQKSMPSL